MNQKDTHENNGGLKGQTVDSFSGKDFHDKHYLMSVNLKKTERIVTAIYMVTDMISDKEPLKFELRTLSLGLLKDMRKMLGRSDHADPMDVIEDINVIKSIVTLGSTIGIVSVMNGNILNGELDKVLESLKSLYGEKDRSYSVHSGYQGIILNPSLFEVNVPKEISPSFMSIGHGVDKGHSNSGNVFYKKEEANLENKMSFSKKTDIGIKIARKNDVLNIVREKGKVSVKDVTTILKDISEKTIQRELLKLVEEGVLKKEGSKRWSTYSIAKG